MSEARAAIAIARRHMSRRFAAAWTARFAIAALAGLCCPAGLVPFAGTVLAVGTAALRPMGSLRDLCYFALPLYGRQLARAQAVGPAVAALAVPLGFETGALAAGKALAWNAALALCLGSAVAALIALSAACREGPRAWLYLALAAAGGALVAVAASVAGMPGRVAPTAAALFLGFIALRQFGETLARYDPV